MKQNTAIAKRFADNQETIKPQHEADVTQMAKFVLVLIDTQTNTTKIRDSKNLVSRHLHKKSDAWAAGVLFYLLFCGALPWKDQFEYENFCNDRSAKDIIIPEEGGYKMIIELLLKKNPEERSSAKETLMQLKAHPIFGSIVETLHEKFCSVDDVCHMIVPDDVQQGIAGMARSNHIADESSSSSSRGF
ncbi:unnamed protein product, partial [Rotaria sp. Silwood2]